MARVPTAVKAGEGVRDQPSIVAVDSGSHINAAFHLLRSERPQGSEDDGR
jgi:hypothetical protein